MSPDQKRLIKHGEKLEKWEQALLKRWKKIPSAIMVTIKTNQYKMENARKKRKFKKIVLAITRTVKIMNMFVYNQITLIYTGIELKFRRDLFKPNEKITMDACFQELENDKKTWWGKTWWGITTVKSKSFNHLSVNYQSNRNAGNNFRLKKQSSSYNFTFGKKTRWFRVW